MPAKRHRHSRPVNPTPKLVLEALEPRIAPTVVTAGGMFGFTDSNGDNIEVYYDGPEGSQIAVLDTGGGDIADGDDIGSIEITGSDVYSSLRIYNDGSGSGDTPIGGNGGIFTTGAEDLGELILNVSPEWDSIGTATLTDGEGITIGGELRTLLMSGPIDFDTGGNFITTGGDLGAAFFLSEMVLDSGTGLADITAGAAGAGDVGVLLVQWDILTSTEGASLEPQAMVGATPLTIADDVGDGTVGSLRLKLSGPEAAADVWAVPVPGGGSVLAWVEIFGEGTGLTVTAQGAGGDVGWVWGDEPALGDIRFRGAADTDVGAVENEVGDLATVANQTAGGDLLWVGAYDDGSADAITTLVSGKIGVLYRGAASEPIMGSEWFTGGLEVEGDLGLLSTGTLTGYVDVDGRLDQARVGTVTHCDLRTGDGIGRLQANLVFSSDIWTDGMLEEMQLGRGGMLDSELQAVGGIGTFNSAGAVVSSNIASLYDSGFGLVGGIIGTFRAPEMHGCYVHAFGGFGTVLVTGVISYTDFDAWYYDPVTDVGGGVERFQVGGMADISGLEVFMDAGQVLIGRGGMAGESVVEIGGNLGTFQNQGDMSGGSYLDVGGDLTGRLLVVGDMLGDVYGCSDIYIGGSARTVHVNGNLLDSGIYIGGDAESVHTGDAIDDYAMISIDGNAGEVRVGALVRGGGVYVGGDVKLVVVGNASEGGGIEIGGSAGTVRVASSFVGSDITVAGDLQGLQVNGSVMGQSTVEVDGNANRIDIRRDLSNEASLDVWGDLGSLTIGGSVTYDSEVDISGNAGKMTIGSSFMDSDIDVGGDLRVLLVGGSVAHGSYLGFAGSITGEITIRGDVTGDSDLNIDGDLDALVIGGAFSTESDVHVGGNAARIVIQEWLEADGVSVDGNLEFLQVRSAVDGSGEGLYVGGDLGTALFTSIVELSIDVSGSADEITVRGGTGDFWVFVGGDLGLICVGRGAKENGIEIAGNATSIQVTGGADSFDVAIDGTLEEFLVKGTLVHSWIDVAGGINSFTVTEVVTGCNIGTRDWDSEGYAIIGAGIGTFQAGELRGVDVLTHGDIGEFIVDGAVTDSGIETTAYDGYGEGDLVGGGGIGSFRALGLYDGNVETYGSITEMLIGRGGLDSYSGVEILGGGSLVKLQTPGFIFGDIYVTGDVTDILTGGADALPGSAPVDFLFVENHSFPTDGELEVEGAILGTIS